MISSSAKARFSLIFSMLVFAAVGPIVRHIPLPESVIAFCRALLGGFFFLCLRQKRETALEEPVGAKIQALLLRPCHGA